MKTFTVFWLDGSKTVIKGDTIAEAFHVAGYGAGTLRAVDFYAAGEPTDYTFVKGQGWSKAA